MDAPIDLVSFVTRAENRVDVLLVLSSGPQTRSELQDETGIPRATLSRILADFRDRNIVIREGHDYHTTPLGDLLAAELRSLFESVAAMGTLQTVRQWLSIDEFDVPVEHLTDADVIVPEPTDPTAPIRRAEELLADGSRVRVVAYNMIPGCLEAVWRAVTEGRQTLEVVLTPATLAVAGEDPAMAEWAADLLASGDASMFVHDGDVLPALFVVDDLIFIAVTDDAGTIQGHIETEDETVQEWAEATIDEYVREADPIEQDVLSG